jgi:hypothetical protein
MCFCFKLKIFNSSKSVIRGIPLETKVKVKKERIVITETEATDTNVIGQFGLD